MGSRGRNLLFLSGLLIFYTISSAAIVVGLQITGARADSVNFIVQRYGLQNNANVFVVNLHDNTLSIISGQTKTVIGADTMVSRYPAILTFPSHSSAITYVINLHDNTLSIISGQTKTVIGNPIYATNDAGETTFGLTHAKSYIITTSHKVGVSGAAPTMASSNLAAPTFTNSTSKEVTTSSHPPMIP